MAQDNFFDTIPVAPKAVPVSTIKPIISDPNKAAEQQREQERLDISRQGAAISAAGESRQVAANTWRDMTAEEVKAAGLPEGVYQVNGLGEKKKISDAPKPEPDTASARAQLLNVIEAAKSAKQKSKEGWFATGFGAPTAAGFTGTTARDVQGLLSTIGGNLAFDRLQKMRAESPTGGALGSISERELDLLQSTIASLDIGQSDEQFQANMDKIIEAYQRVLDKLPGGTAEVEQAPSEAVGATGGTDKVNREEVVGSLWEDPATGIQYSYDPNDPNTFPWGKSPPERRAMYSQSDRGFVGNLVEQVTGSERSTPEIEALPDWTEMPLTEGMFDDPLKAIQIATATMWSSPEETVQILQSNFPDVQVRQDEKGNYIMRSPVDGQEYAIKPGFRASDIPRAAGAVLAFTPAGRAASLGGAASGGAATQAAMEALQAGSGGSFDTGEIVAAGVGGAGGKVLEKGVQAAMPATIKAARTLIPKGTPKPPSGGVNRNAGEIIAAGERESVPVMASDIREPRTWFGRWMRDTGEKIPIAGTGGKRASQQEARVSAIENLYDEFEAGSSAIDDVTADFISTRGKRIGELSRQKKDVFSTLAGSGAPVKKEGAMAVLDTAIAKFRGKESYKPLVAKLEEFRTDLAGAESVTDLELLRKAIGDTFDDETMKSVSTALREVVNGEEGLYNALRTDMGSYIKQNAGEAAFAKWQAANRELADFAEELEKGTLKSVLRTGRATPEEARRLLFSSKPSDVRALMGNLSEEGRKRARAVVIDDIIQKAGGLDELSTAKFRTALKRSRETIGVVFPAEDVTRLEGMLRLYQATKRAEQAGITTPTGQTLAPILGGSALGYAGGGWAGAAAGAGAFGAYARLMESKAMRNLFVALSKTKVGSAGERNVIGMINGYVTQAAEKPLPGVVPAASTQSGGSQ